MDKNHDDLALLMHSALLKTMVPADVPLESKKQDFKFAESRYQSIIDKDPSNFQARNNLSWLVTLADDDEDHLDHGLKLIDDAVELGGELPELLDMTRGR